MAAPAAADEEDARDPDWSDAVVVVVVLRLLPCFFLDGAVDM